MSDISDHFPVFIELPACRVKNKTKIETSRSFSKHCLENIREILSLIEWKDVLDATDVDISYGNFWEYFKTLYDLNFSPVKKKFNINYHKLTVYDSGATQYLYLEKQKLTYSKNQLFRITEISVIYVYTKTPRASKKLYFNANFQKAQKNPKKTWDLIREAIGSESSKSKIDKLTVSDKTVDDPEQIPNEFNKIYCYSWLNHS